MNHYFIESRAKEKLADLRTEGMESQSLHRSGAPVPGLLRAMPKLILFLAILGMLVLLVR
jgi:hypothetical protein